MSKTPLPIWLKCLALYSVVSDPPWADGVKRFLSFTRQITAVCDFYRWAIDCLANYEHERMSRPSLVPSYVTCHCGRRCELLAM